MLQSKEMTAALRHLRRIDPRLAALIEQHGPPRLRRTRNTFQSLAGAIIYQQLSGKAAGTILGRFVALYPKRRIPRPADVLATPLTQLRGVVSVSPAKRRRTCMTWPRSTRMEPCSRAAFPG